MTAAPLRDQIDKTFPERGGMQQHRLRAATPFACLRCGQEKTAKLVAVIEGDWERLVCNACYGNVLSKPE